MRTDVKSAGVAGCLLLVAACAAPGVSHSAAPADEVATERKAARTAAGTGLVLLASGRTLQVELADTPDKRARGYMFREKVRDGEGMLFLMDQLDFHPFWMKNCRVGLDILWLDENWRVVHLEQRVPPCKADPCPSYQPLQASRYVLEMRAGLAAREGITLGDHIIYTPPPAP